MEILGNWPPNHKLFAFFLQLLFFLFVLVEFFCCPFGGQRAHCITILCCIPISLPFPHTPPPPQPQNQKKNPVPVYMLTYHHHFLCHIYFFFSFLSLGLYTANYYFDCIIYRLDLSWRCLLASARMKLQKTALPRN